MEGWISLYKKFKEWQWYKDTNTKTVFIHLLLSANYKDKKWLDIIIKRGELVTSREHLAEELDLSPQQIRTALKKLKSTNEITSKSTSKYTVITIVKYDFYQDNEKISTSELTSNATNEQPASNQQATTTNNIINKQSNNIKFIIPTIKEIKEYCEERNNNVNPNKFYDFYQSNGWKVGKNKMKDWKASVRTWEQNNKKSNNIKKNTAEEEFLNE